MRKFFAATICLAVILTSCEQPTGNENEIPLPTLTIRNESSHDLSDVGFAGIPFATSGNTLPVSAHATMQLTAENANATGRITFTRNDIGIALRTDVISINNQNFTFTFVDNTLVEELANTGNRRPLGQISFLSQLAVERSNLLVARGDVVNLGDSVVNTPRQNVFNIRNTGVGRLLFGTIEPVQITGDTYNVFSVVQPTGAEIAPNDSLPFTINFTPRASQAYTATVTIRSNDPVGDHVFTITAVGVSPRPIATVIFGDTEIGQSGTIDTGEALITLYRNINIEIGNVGSEVLAVDTADITITGTHSSAFSLLTSPGGSISVGAQSTFIVQFRPISQGENNAILTIPTNDVSRNPIIVFLRGTALLGSVVPELRQGTTVIENDTFTSHNFGQVTVGTNSSLMFTIKNAGNVPLELTGNPVIESSNPVFSIPTQPANTSIAPGQEASFIIRYEPTTEGGDTATITFMNNSAAMQFSFPVSGTGYVQRPQITVNRGDTQVNPGVEIDFGTVVTGESGSLTFTIGNSGAATLATTGDAWIGITGPDAELFTIVQQPSSAATVLPGTTVSFEIRYSPTEVGTNFNALVQISTNSRDNGVFTFVVRGNSFTRMPQITVSQGVDAISPNGEIDFGTVFTGESRSLTFTIGNSGDADLSAVDGSWVSIIGPDQYLFAVIEQPSVATTVAPEGTAIFTIRYSPTVAGTNFNALVQIRTNSRNNGTFAFAIRGNSFARLPQITVHQAEVAVNPNGEVNFGSVAVSEYVGLTFVIGNSGDASLSAVGGSWVSVTGADEGLFTVTGQPSSAMNLIPGGSATFTIRYSPTAVGTNFNALVQINTNSRDNAVFTIAVRGDSFARLPQITVHQAEAPVTPNGEINFGSVAVGESGSITFTIGNSGDANLSAAAGSWVSITGADEGLFTVTSQPSAAINVVPGGTADFTIRYNPTAVGIANVIVQIHTNSRDNGVFTIAVRGDGFERRSQVTLHQDDDPITPNGIFDFGRVVVGESGSVTFTVGNAGDANLSAVGGTWVTIVDNEAGLFAVTGQPSSALNVAPGDTMTFTIRYSPVAEGTTTAATVRIHTNSLDNGVFPFTVRGTGHVQRPQITVHQAEAQVHPNGEIDFGNITTGDSNSITFTIGNTGDANLSPAAGTWVSITGADEGQFAVTSQPSAAINVAPGGAATFTIRYNPTAAGIANATVRIHTNSLDNETFLFAVRGNSSDRWPQITVWQDSNAIVPNGQHDFGTTLIYTTQTVTFTIENSGDLDLNIFAFDGNRVNLTGNASGVFAIDLQPAATVAPGDTTTFAIRFSPVTAGTSPSATVRIETDSRNDNDFSFTVTGTGRIFAIGDVGPGGGTIFSAQGGQFAEVSGELGVLNWHNASWAAQNYRGGGFSDWRLPDVFELGWMRQNLHVVGLGGFANASYWSLQSIWAVNFSGGGGLVYTAYWSTHRTRAVRTFSVQ